MARRTQTLPPVTHVLLDGTTMNQAEFDEWKRTHKIPRTHPVCRVLEEFARRQIESGSATA